MGPSLILADPASRWLTSLARPQVRSFISICVGAFVMQVGEIGTLPRSNDTIGAQNSEIPDLDQQGRVGMARRRAALPRKSIAERRRSTSAADGGSCDRTSQNEEISREPASDRYRLDGESLPAVVTVVERGALWRTRRQNLHKQQ